MRQVPENSVKANRIVRQYTQSIPADVDDVFVLLCPVREKAWLEGWNYNMIHSESGYAEEGCVFTTRSGEKETTWVITRRDLENRTIFFTRITPGIVATTLAIRAEPANNKKTDVHIHYTHTSLSEEGDAFLKTIRRRIHKRRFR